MDLAASALEQISQLRSGAVTSEALLDAYQQQYEAANPALNAIVATDFERAKANAKDLDARRARGDDIGPLCGLPMTVKDSYDVDGLPAICGDPALKDRALSTPDAELVCRLINAGAIIWGKTNTPLNAGDIQTYNDVYGTTNNPIDTSRTPGGSSGGAAAALAAHMTPLEIGSDIGGSLRTPSHNCGVCALKPTYGHLPLKGHVPPPPGFEGPDADLAVAGPMARNLEDLALLFAILSNAEVPAKRQQDIGAIRMAIWEEPFFALGQDVAAALKHLDAVLSQKGVRVSKGGPYIDGRHLVDVYQRLLMPIVTAGLPPAVKAGFKAGRAGAKLLAKKGEMSLSNTMISATQSPKELQKTQDDRGALKAVCASFFEGCDVLIAPVTSVPAIPHNTEKEFYSRKIDVDGKAERYTTLFEWISLATACHLPSLVLPVSETASGLPIGLQLIGAEGSDTRLLEIGLAVEQALKR